MLVLSCTSRTEEDAHPKSTPPNATNRPIIMAGVAEPTASSGFFNAKPMARELSVNSMRIGVRNQAAEGR